ncbi:MAG: hypothetical protein ACRENY_09865 [Candidatus Dormibacteria bacterium]
MEQRFELRRIGGQEVAEVWGWPVQLRGDPALCERIRVYLTGPELTLGQSLDEARGERGTRLVRLQPGDPGWLTAALQRAAQELRLRLSEAPLGGS